MKFTIGPMVMGTGMILLAVSAVLLIAGLILLIKLFDGLDLLRIG